MRRRIKVNIVENYQLNEKIIDFFKKYDFHFFESNENILSFKQNSSLVDAWKSNPLKWGSEISVSIFDMTIVADFMVDNDAQMNTKEEKIVWQTFIEHFKNSMVNGATESSQLTITISENKKSRLNYFAWMLFGALIGGLMSLAYTKLNNNSPYLSVLIVPITAILFINGRIKYVKTKRVI